MGGWGWGGGGEDHKSPAPFHPHLSLPGVLVIQSWRWGTAQELVHVWMEEKGSSFYEARESKRVTKPEWESASTPTWKEFALSCVLPLSHWFLIPSVKGHRADILRSASHSSVLAWRIPGTGEPGGLPSMGSHRVGHDWSDLAAAASIWGRWLAQPEGTWAPPPKPSSPQGQGKSSLGSFPREYLGRTGLSPPP